MQTFRKKRRRTDQVNPSQSVTHKARPRLGSECHIVAHELYPRFEGKCTCVSIQ